MSEPPERPVFWALTVVKTFTTPGLTFFMTGAKLMRPPESRDSGRSSNARLTGVTDGDGSAFGFCVKASADCCDRRAAHDDEHQPFVEVIGQLFHILSFDFCVWLLIYLSCLTRDRP